VNRKETATICAVLSAAFPALTMTAETVEMWHSMLSDLDANAVLRAVQDWVLTEERYPTIAGIRKRTAELYGALAPSASEAWIEVDKIAIDYGIYNADKRPRWSHDLIRQAVKAIGYDHICQTSNISTTRAQFIKLYGELKEKADKEVVIHKAFELEQDIVALPNSTAVELEPSQRAITKGDLV
jgi:Loader and inhibitor of phage G40P